MGFNSAFKGLKLHCVCVCVIYTQYLIGQHMAHILFVINLVWFTQIVMSVLFFMLQEVLMCVCVCACACACVSVRMIMLAFNVEVSTAFLHV